MAVDPKVVGGGAAVVAIGGGSGYAISQAVSSSETPSNPKLLKDAINALSGETLGKQIQTNGYELLTEDSSDADWEKLVAVNKTSDSDTSTNKKSLQNECLTLVKLTKDSDTTPSDNYKKTVKKCTKLLTFKDKASTKYLNTSDSNDSGWGAKMNTGTDTDKVKDFKTEVGAKSKFKSSYENKESKTDLINYCKELETKNFKGFSDTELTAEWSLYLRFCTNLGESERNVDFWIKSKVV